jgi:SEC-C motif-containing protein
MAKKADGPRDCPCHSGLRYSACCKALHVGRAAAETPEVLMRSRYAAFALGLGDYLADTLAAGHPDRARPRPELVRELGSTRATHRFMGLRVLSHANDGDQGEVLFHARIFVAGRDRSFVELSRFVREGGAWRYLAGDAHPASFFGDRLATLTRETYVSLVTKDETASP